MVVVSTTNGISEFNGCKRNFLLPGLLKNGNGCARMEISKKMKGKGTKQ